MGTDESYLKMSVLNAVATLREYKILYPEKSIDEIINVIQSLNMYKSNYNYEAARDLIHDVDIETLADIRTIISIIIQKEQPGWLYQLQFGREVFASCLRDNQQTDVLQCFESAGLYVKEPDTSVVDWWDRLAGLARSSEDDKKLKSGRFGEMLTLDYETRLLEGYNVKPKWVSVENNSAGYDVLSFSCNPSGLKQKFIEVKTCKTRPVCFYLTKNEWNSALNLGENYYFHIWHAPNRKLIELTVTQVEENIPTNRGTGEWQTTLIDIDSLFLKSKQ